MFATYTILQRCAYIFFHISVDSSDSFQIKNTNAAQHFCTSKKSKGNWNNHERQRNLHHGRIVYGVATVSEKGQIAIPVDLRKDLEIASGEKLMVMRRRDDAGISLIKLSAVDDLMHQIQEDETLFSKIKDQEVEHVG